MKIETKFNVDDSVYIMDKNKPVVRTIRRINITSGNVVGLPDPYITYYFKDCGDDVYKSEKQLFINFNEIVEYLQKSITS